MVLAEFIKDYSIGDLITAAALFLTIIGWIVVYIFNRKAQDRLFLNQVINDARLRITEAIREYQDWLIEANGVWLTFSTLSMWSIEHIREMMESGLQQEILELSLSNSYVEFVLVLEEHEILFPYTRLCREDFRVRHFEISSILDEMQNFLAIKDMEADEKINAEKELSGKKELVNDQIALLEDLRIHLQNKSLSKITKHKVRERTPLDPTLPRLVYNKANNLLVVEKSTQVLTTKGLTQQESS